MANFSRGIAEFFDQIRGETQGCLLKDSFDKRVRIDLPVPLPCSHTTPHPPHALPLTLPTPFPFPLLFH